MQATDGNFYGTTYGGGTSDNCNFLGMPGCGTVFKISAAGALTTLHSFEGNDGAQFFTVSPLGLKSSVGMKNEEQKAARGLYLARCYLHEAYYRA